MTDMIRYIGLLDDEQIELDSAALALSALDHEGVDLDPYLALLGEMSHALAEAGRSASDPQAQGRVLAKTIGAGFGFRGDSESYDVPLNADMIRVIDRRRGLPVSLSILYVAAARRMGWHAHALNTPAHVLVRVGPDDAAALIDPFNGGAQVMQAQLSALMAQAVRQGAWRAEDAVLPMSNRMTLVRLLVNQATRAEGSGDTGRAKTIYERMTVIAPDHGQGWWDLARLQLIEGNVDAGRASLSAMLEITRDPERRTIITDLLDRLGGGRAA